VSRLTDHALRHPRSTLATWGVITLILAALGLGVQNRLSSSSIEPPGSESAAAASLNTAGFGTNESVPILLQGPASALDRQGPKLVQALRQRWPTLSPWGPGSLSRLRPHPGAAILLVDVQYPASAQLSERLAPLHSVIGAQVRRPVAAAVSGATAIGQALNAETLSSAETAQEIAIPVLLFVLLLVFRAPIAAAIPAGVGLATVGASAGVISLVSTLLSLTALAVSIAAMIGLALGVDYSLLIVSRFREELARSDADPTRAAQTAARTAGRTVVFAGAALLLAMLTATALAPGDVLVSITAGVVIAVVLSVITGLTVVPAALVLLGQRIDRWSLGTPRTTSPVLTAIAAGAARIPRTAVAGVLAVLLLLAAPVTAIATAAVNPTELPSSDAARRTFERISSLLGYGYTTPMQVVIRANHGLITSPHMLSQIARFQEQVARNPKVAAVLGPGALAGRAAQVEHLPSQLANVRSRASAAATGVGELRNGMHRASAAAGTIGDGAVQAAHGTSTLAAGSDSASGAAGVLHGALVKGGAGMAQLTGHLSRAAAGAEALSRGAGTGSGAVSGLIDGLNKLDSALGQMESADTQLASALTSGAGQLASLESPAATARDQLQAARAALQHMSVGKVDPQYRPTVTAVDTALAAVTGVNPETSAPVAGGYSGLPDALNSAAGHLSTAASSARALATGAGRLRDGVRREIGGLRQLAAGLDTLRINGNKLGSGLGEATAGTATAKRQLGELAGGAAQLASGNSQLSSGIKRLSAIGQIGSGARLLDGRLASGYQRSRGLQTGLAHSSALILQVSGPLAAVGPSPSGQLAAGHLLLAGAQHASVAQRSQLSYVVNDNGAAQTALVYVFPRVLPISAAGNRLYDELRAATRRFGAQNDATALLGGLGSDLIDYQRVVSAFIPLLVAFLAVLTYLLLVVVLRSVVLPAIAIAMNLLVLAATFGALELLFQGSHPLLGGPGQVDIVTAVGILTVLFALSIDYQVFLMSRMREGYDALGDSKRAIEYGIGRTGRVVTGAALIMTAVFLSFGSSTFIIPRQFGVGLAIAVILDAIVLRMVMLPAVMTLLGRRCWWAPKIIERIVPRIEIEGRTPPASATSNGAGASRLPGTVGVRTQRV
jgi:RND superfamily putative drug exporter